jgi:hypothetical protein
MTKQTEKEIRFICAYCTLETTVSVSISEPLPTHRKSVSILCYCQYCEQPNKLQIPDNLDVQRFILDKERGFQGYTSDGIPLLQGEKDK